MCGGGGGGGLRELSRGSRTYGKTQENLNAKRLALIVNKNFTDYVEKWLLSHQKSNYKEVHHHKSHKFLSFHVTMIMKQWKSYTMRKLLTRNLVVTIF